MDDYISRYLQWANLLLSIIAIILLGVVISQVYVASSVTTIKEAVVILQRQMKEVQGALILKDKSKEQELTQ